MSNTPSGTQAICRRLFNGYQYSKSDLDAKGLNQEYATLRSRFDWFRDHLALSGFSLVNEDGVIFLINTSKSLSKEEKQTIVALFLLADLYLELGHTFSDLFVNMIQWRDLNWFRDGYGRDYLSQVGFEEADLTELEKLFKKISNKGLVKINHASEGITLRQPAERIVHMARTLHKQLNDQKGEENA
jgi:hypothetical protein